MMDWISEVTHLFRFNLQTTSLAQELVDGYLLRMRIEGTMVRDADVHFLGVVAMFVAAKYEEVYPPESTVVAEKIAHSAFTSKQILKKERDFMVAFDFEFTFVTFQNILGAY